MTSNSQEIALCVTGLCFPWREVRMQCFTKPAPRLKGMAGIEVLGLGQGIQRVAPQAQEAGTIQ